MLLTLVVGERRGGLAAPALLGLALGLAILGNSRLVLLPLVVAGYLLWRRKGWQTVGVTLAACAVALLPWLVRNEVERRLLHAEHRLARRLEGEQPRDVRHAGRGRLDRRRARAFPARRPGRSSRPISRSPGRPTTVDECAQMRLYRRETIDFWQEHPGEKARLMGQAARMLWDPRSIRTEGRAEAGGFVDDARTWAQPLHAIPLYVLGVIGLVVMPRRIAVLFVALLAYNTLAALVFAGATRYRVPWDFVLALAAGAAVVWLLDRWSAGAMKVVHVHRIGGIGGSERHLLTLLPALAAKGVDVSFVGLDMPGADPFYAELDVPVRAADAAVAAPRGA